MSAGTITLTNNSDAVAGAGTAFLTDLAAGDFIVANVGGIAYTLPVKAVASATALTIINKFTGPTMIGLAWFIAKREQQAMITAALVAQSAEALRGLNFDKSNWQAVFSAAGDITVTTPDGTQFTGPSWQKIVTLLAQSDIEVIQPLADQVRADAQQVAADKTAAQTANADAQTAKTAAESASGTASAAKTDAVAAKDSAVSAAGTATSQATASEASAVRAEAAADTIDTTVFLRKDGNLSGLTDKVAARAELAVYSKQEVDDAIASAGTGQTVPVNKGGTGAITAAEALTNLGAYSKAEVNARIGHALVDAGTITANQRKVLTNPFGINTPVIVVAEVQRSAGNWSACGSFLIVNNQSFGMGVTYREGEGIVIQTGNGGLAASVSSLSGDGFGASGAPAVTSGSVRVHVWKVTA